MPGWQAGSNSGKMPVGAGGSARCGSGAGPSYTVNDVQNRVDAVKGIMCARGERGTLARGKRPRARARR